MFLPDGLHPSSSTLPIIVPDHHPIARKVKKTGGGLFLSRSNGNNGGRVEYDQLFRVANLEIKDGEMIRIPTHNGSSGRSLRTASRDRRDRNGLFSAK